MQVLRAGDRLQIRVLDLAEGGESFARLDNGMSVFVDGMLVPGDEAEVELTQVKKRQARARCIQLTAPAADRVDAPCPLFGRCGGCRWQQLPYVRELELKQKLVSDALLRIGRFESLELQPMVPSPDAFRYRNKVEFVFFDDGYDLVLGLHQAGEASTVLDVADCRLVPETWALRVATVREWAREQGLRVYDPESKTGCLRSLILRQSPYTGECMLVLVTGNDDLDSDGLLKALQDEALHTVVQAIAPGFNRTRYERTITLRGSGNITEHFLTLPFRVSPAAFLQPNTLQAEALYARALEWARLTKDHRVLDLYCGIGTLSVLAAKQAGQVIGLDVVSDAIEDARYNAKANGVDKLQFQVANLGQKDRCELPGKADVVLVDPPRSGMHPSVVAALRRLSPQRIIYVSCKPSSLARDARALCEDGMYTLKACQPFDQFPQTEHVECVAWLERC